MKLEIIKGSVVDSKCDVIVNAANEGLQAESVELFFLLPVFQNFKENAMLLVGVKQDMLL